MSKVENSYQPRLKQYWSNIISTLIGHKWTDMFANFYFHSHGQICIYAKFAYMQIEICTWSQPGASFKNLQMLQILHMCANPFTWTYLHTWVYLHIFKYLQRMQICPRESTLRLRRYGKQMSSTTQVLYCHYSVCSAGEYIPIGKKKTTTKHHIWKV